ncbi:peptide/nickel transport system permease protein [Tenacibaculum mesophilum]|uniref:ABC transporter permease n=1 Tax=Tenacibaculum mesophilum TaxID=104268 RepID=A0ABM7CFT7_9FLAO|nr:ABC transporter permease [Tenacibaculum mesophilum]AZJ32645.1 ABC transporter permease [Tenacibaculum mesophilum]QFS27897.1 ABC transporter permease subunit [Tenacibaculum mesophilum]SHG06472.1 peptide/nickel transport system permease protein [Tenacibaculum mesophilum]
MNNNTGTSLWQIAIQKFKRSKTGMFSFGYIILCGFIAVFCYVLAPDNSNSANQMHLEIHSKPPGFSVQLLSIPSEVKNQQSWFSVFMMGKQHSATEIPIKSFSVKNNQLEIIKYSDGLPKELPVSYKQYIQQKTFYLGTDKYGRDLLSRLLIGARISFFIGFIAVFISLLIGIPIGAIAGYFGGKIDDFIMWVINITWSIPTLLLVIAITLALGKGFWQVFIAVGLTMWVEVARVVRGQVITTKQQQYVEAAKALGFSDFRIIFKHILPNILAPIIVISAANFAAAILIESGLSFLGIGAQPPTPSWGAMIKNHYNYIILGKPFLALIPGLAIMSLVMAFMLIGNTLRDALDVKA